MGMKTMAKTKPDKAKPEPGRAVRLVLTLRQHAELRVQAARADMTLAEWARRAVVTALGMDPEEEGKLS